MEVLNACAACVQKVIETFYRVVTRSIKKDGEIQCTNFYLLLFLDQECGTHDLVKTNSRIQGCIKEIERVISSLHGVI